MIKAYPPARSARLDISTHCQLKCPSCPTASGQIGAELGSGFMPADQFEHFMRDNSQIAHIELSNWGEALLNPDFTSITEYAYNHNVALTIGNGVNLNTAKQEALESLVRNKVRMVTCSIDGASQEIYAQYRKGGILERVIANIKAINEYKAQYRSRFPILLWQFVVFDHNRHEIPAAQRMARELGMEFFAKISWDSNLAPADVSKESYQEKTGKAYMQGYICKQLFSSPQINWDGRLLGCCVNSWGNFGNVFETPLATLWNQESITHARQMLLGKAQAKQDIPCSSCDIYRSMQSRSKYLNHSETKDPLAIRLGLRLGRRGIALANRYAWAELLMEHAIRSAISSMPQYTD